MDFLQKIGAWVLGEDLEALEFEEQVERSIRAATTLAEAEVVMLQRNIKALEDLEREAGEAIINNPFAQEQILEQLEERVAHLRHGVDRIARTHMRVS